MDDNFSDIILSEEYFDFISDYELLSKEDLSVQQMCTIRIDALYASIYVPMQLIPENVLDKYGYKVFARLYGLLDIPGLEVSGVTRQRNVPDLILRGEGVLIGIVDTGIDYTHTAFQKNNGTKIVSIWDQTIQGISLPEGLLYGTKFTREQINEALLSNNPGAIVPRFDEVGRGTYLAEIAAGSVDNGQSFSGVVSDAKLVVVNLKPAKQNLRNLYLVPSDANCYQENDIMLGVKYLIEVARKLKRPISICIGLGTSQVAHDINIFLSMYHSSISQMDGFAVMIAAENEGNSRHYFESVMRLGTDNETVELKVGPKEPRYMMEIWGNPPVTFDVDMISPSGEFVLKMIPRLGEHREYSCKR